MCTVVTEVTVAGWDEIGCGLDFLPKTLDDSGG